MKLIAKVNFHYYQQQSLNKIEKRNYQMKVNEISIPSSVNENSEQVSTPNWHGSTQRYHQMSQMYRLDELLSRNEQIYQNMRHQLQEITKSNKNIDANINNIKPMSDSDININDAPQQGQYEDRRRNSLITYEDPYTFQSRDSQQFSYSNSAQFVKPSNQLKIPQPSQKIKSDSRKSSKKNIVYQKIQVNDIYGNPEHTIFENNLKKMSKKSLKHSQKKDLPQIEKLPSKQSSYHQIDSSPIESQHHNTDSINYSIVTNKGCMDRESKQRIVLQQINENQQREDEKEDEQQYDTFDEDQKYSRFLQELHYQKKYVEEQEQNVTPNRQQNFRGTAYSDRTSKILTNRSHYYQSIPQLPHQKVLLYVPFNRLYSSPILQQINSTKLILARKSKTKISSNTSIERIVNGIKYSNVNFITDQIKLYGLILKEAQQVEKVLRIRREKLSLTQNYKDSVDIGIIGGQNSLKKKLHYALIAHIYTKIREEVDTYITKFEEEARVCEEQLNFQNLTFRIQHQQQHSVNEPVIMGYQEQISYNLEDNHIALSNMNSFISQIFDTMKTKSSTSSNHVQNMYYIRMTKLALFQKMKGKKDRVLLSVKIISTNKVENQFIHSLNLDICLYSANPLPKYYQQIYQTLQCYNIHNNKNRQQRNRGWERTDRKKSRTPLKKSIGTTTKKKSQISF